MNPLNKLAIELYEKYSSHSFNAGIYIGNQRYHLKEIRDMEDLCEMGEIEVVCFDSKKGEGFEVYPSQYVSHKFTDNQLEIILKNKEAIFGLG